MPLLKFYIQLDENRVVSSVVLSNAIEVTIHLHSLIIIMICSKMIIISLLFHYCLYYRKMWICLEKQDFLSMVRDNKEKIRIYVCRCVMEWDILRMLMNGLNVPNKLLRSILVVSTCKTATRAQIKS